MNGNFTLEPVKKEKADLVLLATLVAIVGLGLVTLFSASYFKGVRLANSAWFFVQKQAILLAIGTVGAWLLSRIAWDALRKTVPVLLLVSFVLMLLTFLPIWDAGDILGARRWIIKWGFSFQPSELVKLTVVLYLASMFTKKQGQLDDVAQSLLPPFAVSFSFVVLTLLQNDYSTAMFLLFVILAMFFVAEIKMRYFAVIVSVAAGLGVVGVLAAPYRIERILTFFSPSRDPHGASFQIQASREALASGGFWGSGLGAGTHKLGGIPEVQNDFIFAAYGEEVGYWGVVLLVGLFCVLAWRGYRAMLAQTQSFPKLVAFGTTTFLLYQMLINIAVVAGSVPATGVTLPFFSSGGTSIVISMLMAGLLVNLSRAKGGPRV